MPPCQICGDNSGLGYTCNECGGKYCSDHRLPEAHRCDALSTTFTKPFESDAPSTTGLSDHAERHERVRDKQVEKTDSREDVTGREASKNRKRDREQPPEEDRYQCPGCQDHFYLRRACSNCGDRYCTDCRPPAAHNCPQATATASTSSSGTHRAGRRYGTQATNNLESNARSSSGSTLLTYLLAPFVLVWWWKKPLLLLGLVVLGASLAPGVPPESFLSSSDTAAIRDTADSIVAGPTTVTETAAGDAAAATQTTTTQPTTTADTSVSEAEIETVIHARVNEIRASRGLSTLRIQSSFTTAARGHSREMADRGELYHGDIRARYGSQCSAVGENVAYTYADANIRTSSGELVNHDGNETKIAHGIVRQWMNSPGHRENILRGRWYAEGIGVNTTTVDGKTRVYATQGFCGN